MNASKLIIIIILITAIILFSCPCTDEPPEPDPPPVVTGVVASKLQYDNHIRVTWDHADGADSYKVYRYLHKSPDTLNMDFTRTTNSFDDTTANPDTPYFYKVASVIGTATSELSANYVEGIYNTIIDPFELNDDITQAAVVSGQVATAVIYSFNYGEAQDTDWYVYNTAGYIMVTIKITLPPGSPFHGQLTLEIDNTGVSETLYEGENTLDYSGSDDLYFSIYFTVVDPEINEIDTYTVVLEFI